MLVFENYFLYIIMNIPIKNVFFRYANIMLTIFIIHKIIQSNYSISAANPPLRASRITILSFLFTERSYLL